MWRTFQSRVVLCGIAALLGVLVFGGSSTIGEEPSAEPTAKTAAAVTAGAKIRFSKLEHDFGTAVSGPELKATFEFKNVGDDVLVIQKVKGG